MKINTNNGVATRAVVAGTLAIVTAVSAVGCASGGDSSTAAGAEEAGGAPETTDLRVGVTPVGDFAPIYYAEANGIFEEHGLDIEIDPKGASEVPPLVANSYQAVSMSWTTYVQAVAQGVELRGVFPGIEGQPDTQTGIYVMPSSGISEPDDLVGEKLAVNQPRAALELNSRVVLEELGVDPEQVSFQVIPLSTMVDTLVNGSVDAAYLMPPFSTLAEDQGAELIIDPYKHSLEGTPIAGYVMTEDFVAENPNTVDAFQAAMTEAAEELNDPEVYREFVTTYTELTPELAEKSPAFHFPTEIDKDKFQQLADMMASQGFSTQQVDVADTIIEKDG